LSTRNQRQETGEVPSQPLANRVRDRLITNNFDMLLGKARGSNSSEQYLVGLFEAAIRIDRKDDRSSATHDPVGPSKPFFESAKADLRLQTAYNVDIDSMHEHASDLTWHVCRDCMCEHVAEAADGDPRNS
jgi:hypothetical protein